MIADPEHEQVAELLGVYALHAVDPDESRLVEAHLAACPRCRAEIDGLRQLAADLAIVGSPESEQPPVALWDRIAARIGDQTDDAPDTIAVLDVLGPSRRSSRLRRVDRRATWLGGIVGSAAAAAIAVLAVGLVHTQGQVHDLQSALARRGSEVAVQDALSSPGHRVVELRGSGGTQLAEVVVRRNGSGFIVRSTMSRLPATETYQLWASINGRPISLGLLGRSPASGTAFSLGTSAGVRELMVTVEPDGGVPTPDRSPIATAPLSLS